MRKLTIFALLLSSPAWAGWSSVAEDEVGVTYADPADVVRNGNLSRMWSLLDYKNFQRMVEVGYFSQKTQVEYDCVKRQSRGLRLSLHAEHMGEGKIIYTDESPHEWEAISAETMSEALWKIACK
jgi:hypothetical protein